MIFVLFVFLAFSLCAVEGIDLLQFARVRSAEVVKWFAPGGLFQRYNFEGGGSAEVSLYAGPVRDPGSGKISVVGRGPSASERCRLEISTSMSGNSATTECSYTADLKKNASVVTAMSHAQEGRVTIVSPHDDNVSETIFSGTVSPDATRCDVAECRHIYCGCREGVAWRWLALRLPRGENFFVSFCLKFDDLSKLFVGWGIMRYNADNQEFPIISRQEGGRWIDF